jgi:hypothetical protein
MATHTESLSHSQIPKIALPKYKAWGDILRWCLQENVPGEFPLLQVYLSSVKERSFSNVCGRWTGKNQRCSL